MLASFDGEVVHRAHYVAVRTPANPSFWWGNFILFDRPPAEDDPEPWEAIFDAEVGHLPGVNHVNLAWASSEGEPTAVEPFLARGYFLTRNIYLVADGEMPPSPPPQGVEVRQISGGREWEMALRNQHDCLEGANDTEAFRAFQTVQMARYRKMTEAGFGLWLGAFLGGRLVGDMGVFGEGGLARCQSVGVAPGYRRRGIAAALVGRACVLARQALAAERVVIMTGEEHPARRIYERIGFVPVEHAPSLARAGRAGQA